jgi:hypothetical protein
VDSASASGRRGPAAPAAEERGRSQEAQAPEQRAGDSDGGSSARSSSDSAAALKPPDAAPGAAAAAPEERHLPGYLRCPLSGEIFREPVVAADGYTYERRALERYMVREGGASDLRSPVTGQPLASREVYANHIVSLALKALRAASSVVSGGL